MGAKKCLYRSKYVGKRKGDTCRLLWWTAYSWFWPWASSPLKPFSFEAIAEQKHVFFVTHSREVGELKSAYIDQIEEEGEIESYVICFNGPDIADFSSCFWFTSKPLVLSCSFGSFPCPIIYIVSLNIPLNWIITTLSSFRCRYTVIYLLLGEITEIGFFFALFCSF